MQGILAGPLEIAGAVPYRSEALRCLHANAGLHPTGPETLVPQGFARLSRAPLAGRGTNPARYCTTFMSGVQHNPRRIVMPTRYYTFVEPGPDGQPVYTTVSDDDIVRDYYPYWDQAMRKRYGASYTDRWCPRDCINDWVVVNCAWPNEQGGQ
jgi:hypothetical protein